MKHPKHKKLHRHLYEWLLQKTPDIGTRADCITRSAALSINTHPTNAGLVEAVTCDLYDFGKHRHHECVCFPVYADHTVKELLLNSNNVSTLHTTTSVFYPPPQVVQRLLLSAATEGKPFGDPAHVLRRKPRNLVGFPYCAIPGGRPTSGLVARTATEVMTSKRNGHTATVTTTFPALPTQEPDCNDKSYHSSRKASACEVDRCMWNFVKNYTSTTSNWVTFSDELGTPLHAEWNTSVILVTGIHWGVYPEHKDPDKVSNMRVTDPWGSALASSYSNYLTSIGLPAPTSTVKRNMFGQKEKARIPECHNETDCWRYCENRQHVMKVQMYELLGFAVIISALAISGMVARRFCRRAAGASRWPARQEQVSQTGVTDTAAVEHQGRGNPVTQTQVAEGLSDGASTAGTLGRATEEGRGRPVVRFSEADVQVSREQAREGTVKGAGKVGGRAAGYEMSEWGSIRNRHAPAQSR